MATTVNLSMSRGDTKIGQVTVSNLSASGLTGCSFWFTAKNKVSDADASAVIKKLPVDFSIITVGSDTVAGVAQFTIAPADTDTLADYAVSLVYDVQMKDTNGNITTLVDGTLLVNPDKTRAAS